MPELAQKITIDRKRQVVLIDGEEFAYWLAEQGPEVVSPCDSNALPVVLLPVLAHDLEIIPKDD